MSEKELALRLLENTPDNKIGYVIAYLRGLNAEEDSDDEFCSKLLNDYLSDKEKGEFVSFDEAVRLCGVDINAIHD